MEHNTTRYYYSCCIATVCKITTRPGWCDDSLLLLLLLLLLLFICVCVSAVDNIHMKTCMAYEDVIKAQPTHEVSPSADEEAL